MKIDGFDRNSADILRVDNREVARKVKDFPKTGDERVEDPGRFDSKFQNKSREANDLHKRPEKVDVVELRSKAPEKKQVSERNTEDSGSKDNSVSYQRRPDDRSRLSTSVPRKDLDLQIAKKSEKERVENVPQSNEVVNRENVYQSETKKIQESQSNQDQKVKVAVQSKNDRQESTFVKEKVESKTDQTAKVKEDRAIKDQSPAERLKIQDNHQESSDPVKNVNLLA